MEALGRCAIGEAWLDGGEMGRCWVMVREMGRQGVIVKALW